MTTSQKSLAYLRFVVIFSFFLLPFSLLFSLFHSILFLSLSFFLSFVLLLSFFSLSSLYYFFSLILSSFVLALSLSCFFFLPTRDFTLNLTLTITLTLFLTLSRTLSQNWICPCFTFAFRYEAIKVKEHPLTGQPEFPLVHYFQLGPFLGNMHLAEDRILCFETMVQLSEAWIMHECKGPMAKTDAPETIEGLICRRHRWLNGTFFAAMYIVMYFPRVINDTVHSGVRKCLFFWEFVFIATVLTVTWMLFNLHLTTFYLIWEGGFCNSFGDTSDEKGGEDVQLLMSSFLIASGGRAIPMTPKSTKGSELLSPRASSKRGTCFRPSCLPLFSSHSWQSVPCPPPVLVLYIFAHSPLGWHPDGVLDPPLFDDATVNPVVDEYLNPMNIGHLPLLSACLPACLCSVVRILTPALLVRACSYVPPSSLQTVISLHRFV
jgi:hypothetical protein